MDLEKTQIVDCIEVVAPGRCYSQEDARVQAICEATHTPAVIAEYQAMQTPVEE